MPCLLPLTAGGTRPPIILADSSIVIGSGDAAQIRLKSLSVSKAHAVLLVDDAKAYVRDLASRTELFVNDVAVRDAVLKHGDVVRVGKFGFGVVEDAAVQARPPRPPAPAVAFRVEGEADDRRVIAPVVLIGRRGRCDISIADDSVSGAHAILFRIGARWFVRDLMSRTGTFVNGTLVRQQRTLEAGDSIRIGRREIRFLGEERLGTPRMALTGDIVEPTSLGMVDDVAAVSPSVTPGPAELAESRGAAVEVPPAAAPAAVPARQEDVATAPAGAAAEARTPGGASVEAPLPAPVTTGASSAGPAEPVRHAEEAAEVREASPPVASPAPSFSTQQIVGPVNERGVAQGETDAGTVGGAFPSPDTTSAGAAEAGAPESDAYEPPLLPPPRSASAAEEAGVGRAGDAVRGPKPVESATTETGRVHAEPLNTALHGLAAEVAASVEVRPPAESDSGLGQEDEPQGQANPSDTEWDQAVTVWSFEDLARRSSGDGDVDESHSTVSRRRLLWVAVAAGVVCAGAVGGLVVYKMR